MRFRVSRFDHRQWHRVFAWQPVRIDDRIVWLEPVERRGLAANKDCVYEYRVPSREPSFRGSWRRPIWPSP
jgi:hypothetical protein